MAVWQIGVAANAIIAAASLAIAWRVGARLLKSHSPAADKLLLATVVVFVVCGLGYLLHAVHTLQSTPTALATRSGTDWVMIGWDAMIATYFVALRRRIGQILLDRPLPGAQAGAGEASAASAQRDALTGLPNRAAFNARMTTLRGADGRGPLHRAVLLLDLDEFKRVNDRAGHDAGDELLCAASERLAGALRASEMVARVGGDEFAVALDGIGGRAEAIAVARRISDELHRPFAIGTERFELSVSVGIALDAYERAAPDALIRDANLAMHAAKANGKDRYEIFEPGMIAGGELLAGLEADIRRGLAENEFVLEFQPEVSLESGRVEGFEALVRWRHPDRGLLAPDSFIPQAERSNCIALIDDFVIAAACRAVMAWPSEDGGPTGHFIAVNCAASELQRPELPVVVANALAEAGLAPERLIIEITERSLIADSPDTIATMRALRALGVRIALDDFGTGYSSLHQLHELPLDMIKIDRRFMRALDHTRSRAIVAALVDLSHELGLTAVAEGIETETERDATAAMGCTLGQGYLFARPMSGMKVFELLARRTPIAS